MSFSSALTYDFETYSAAQQRWLEVSSTSNFESFRCRSFSFGDLELMWCCPWLRRSSLVRAMAFRLVALKRAQKDAHRTAHARAENVSGMWCVLCASLHLPLPHHSPLPCSPFAIARRVFRALRIVRESRGGKEKGR